ncbi:acyl-CoA N-acyltransferase [Cylindrobasidium torrendii FP15055 ss-10]|uniref:Acyl-CoA N-acyltransferase n=1 Tax=Cylindrobasidium torrendii FP15055 ss-10 TaxID=1314674 RepID=A0A0D7B7R8_9AGAR|nr:acyl-CoA N-acyltransferase [Cylindrobasidium torrendii FP15055 ss-10]
MELRTINTRFAAAPPSTFICWPLVDNVNYPSFLSAMFTTARLHIRPFDETDLAAVDRLWMDPRVDPTRTAGTMELLMDKLHSNLSLLFVVLETLDTREFVGISTLAADGEWGVMLRPEWWGRGLGREVALWILDFAFTQYAMGEVNLRVLTWNTRAQRLYRSIGFTEIARGNGIIQMIYTRVAWAEEQRRREQACGVRPPTPPPKYADIYPVPVCKPAPGKKTRISFLSLRRSSTAASP